MHDPQNVEAWYQLASLVNEPERVKYCLEQVLLIDPNHIGARERLQAMQIEKSDLAPTPISLPEWKDVRCPYLGLIEDPTSLMAFPSPQNYCHHLTNAKAVDMELQKSICLKEEHNLCPQFIGCIPIEENTVSKKSTGKSLNLLERVRTWGLFGLALLISYVSLIYLI
jgi:hypothetical protein